MNYVKYMMNAKDKMNKKNQQGASFTDDGFAMSKDQQPQKKRDYSFTRYIDACVCICRCGLHHA